ncbi:MAG: phosphoenolpyruvate carboxykinase (GTP) [Chlamydiae bacterium]|nr:MAG: phosphoenolpyruvate carboxykinase (GTP) [Chlamydiota bacterium]
MNENSFAKLKNLNNDALIDFVTKYVELCNPDTVYVCDDSVEDRTYIRNRSIELGEEQKLATEGHTIHFDGPKDQARDKANTRYLVREGVNLGEKLNTKNYQEGYDEVHEYFKNSMVGKQVYVRFFCLGPVNSEFSLSCVQITDSAYVAHSEDLLYRGGYEQFKKVGNTKKFFRFVHTAGELENNVSKNVDKRRVFIDLENDIVYSTNTQYAGNTVGLKKLAMRLAINKCKDEGWLTEHMFVMGVKGPDNRKTYFAGAFPSACGKTSTAMLPGETIIGDDIAYIRARNGKAYAVNVENGIFGIIRDVNEKDDPIIWNVLNSPGEVIFSNILKDENGKVYWLGMGTETADKGINFAGEWEKGKKDANGNDIPLAHKNARYTVELDRLDNSDENTQNPEGVEIGGFIYGGRDSDTSVPVAESFNFAHGVLMYGATLESETTAATLGAEGVRTFNLMSILDFLAYPLNNYIQHNLNFGAGIENPPRVFGVNYFLKSKDGKYLNGMLDKGVWVKWMELRVNDDVDVITTPIGNIPLYEDLEKIFSEILGKTYTKEQYVEQFTIRVPELIAKINRIRKVYENETGEAIKQLFTEFDAQEQRLKELQSEKGDHVSPFDI